MLFYFPYILASLFLAATKRASAMMLALLFLFLWLLVPIAFQFPVGGDFHSLILRSTLVNQFDFGIFFEISVAFSDFLGMNVSSFYALVSLIVAFVLTFSFGQYYLIASPFVFVLIITGYQRQGLALLLIMLAIEFFDRRYKVLAAICAFAAVLSHATSFMPLAIFAYSMYFQSKGRKKIFLSLIPLVLVVFSFEVLTGYSAVLDHMIQHYFSSSASSAGAIPRVGLSLLCFAITQHYFCRFDKIFVFYTLFVCVLFVIFEATTIADRLNLVSLLFIAKNLSNAKSLTRLIVVAAHSVTFWVWAKHSAQFESHWSIL